MRLGDVATHATAVLRLGAIHYTTGEYDKAVVYLRQGVELTGGERLRERFGMAGLASVLARHWLARALAELGEFSEGLAMAREGLDINLSTDNVASLRDRLRGGRIRPPLPRGLDGGARAAHASRRGRSGG